MLLNQFRFIHQLKKGIEMNMLKKMVATMFFITASMHANAAVVRIDAAAFTPQAGLITFSEMSLGTVNPVYSPAAYGGGSTAPTVSFGSYFTGQSITPGACGPGAAPTGCVTGTPTGPISLALGAGGAFITQDGSNPTSPVLSGSPLFNGPIAIISKYRNNGQTCVCANRLYIQDSVYDAFAEKLKAAVAKLKIGNGLEDGSKAQDDALRALGAMGVMRPGRAGSL